MGEGANGFGNGEIVMGMMLMKSGRMAMNGLHWQYAKKNTMLCMFIIIFCLFSVFLRLLSPQTIQKGRCGRIQANPQMRLAQHRALKTASSGFRSLRHLAIHFFPKQFTVGFTLKKKRGVYRLVRACSVGRGLGVPWAWRGRGLGVRGLGVRGLGVAWAWLGRGVGVAWAWRGRGLGVGVAWAWRGRGLGVAWAWLGRGLGVAWAWRGRGLGVAWAWRGLRTWSCYCEDLWGVFQGPWPTCYGVNDTDYHHHHQQQKQ